jgi:phosphatidylserine decarboxylase
MPSQLWVRRVRWLQTVLFIAAIHQGAAQTGAVTCQAIVMLSDKWVQTSNNVSFASVNLNIVNTHATTVPVPWTLTLKNHAYGMIKQVNLLALFKYSIP